LTRAPKRQVTRGAHTAADIHGFSQRSQYLRRIRAAVRDNSHRAFLQADPIL